jgi:hypothetical protein
MEANTLLETIHCMCRDNKHDCYECQLAYMNKYNIPQCYFQFTTPPKVIGSIDEIIRICEHYRVEHNMK